MGGGDGLNYFRVLVGLEGVTGSAKGGLNVSMKFWGLNSLCQGRFDSNIMRLKHVRSTSLYVCKLLLGIASLRRLKIGQL